MAGPKSGEVPGELARAAARFAVVAGAHLGERTSEYLGREVWVRWDTRLVRIFNHRFEQIALHVWHEQVRFSTLGEHVAARRSAAWSLGLIIS